MFSQADDPVARGEMTTRPSVADVDSHDLVATRTVETSPLLSRRVVETPGLRRGAKLFEFETLLAVVCVLLLGFTLFHVTDAGAPIRGAVDAERLVERQAAVAGIVETADPEAEVEALADGPGWAGEAPTVLDLGLSLETLASGAASVVGGTTAASAAQ